MDIHMYEESFLDSFQRLRGVIFGHKIISLCIAIGLILLTIGISLVFSLRNAWLNIYVTPIDASIKINGKDYTNGTYVFYPGTYTATVSCDGFEEKSFSLNLSLDTYENLFVYLTGPNNDFAFYETHEDDYQVLAQVADDNAIPFIEKVENAKKIYDELPTGVFDGDSLLFTVVKGDNCAPLCLKVKKMVNGDYGNKVKEFLSNKGFNADDYVINYEDFKFKEADGTE